MVDELMNFMMKYFNVEGIEKDTPIFDMGFVNSLFSMQLIIFLEKNMNITINAEDMDIDNFSTINNIIRFIERKRM